MKRLCCVEREDIWIEVGTAYHFQAKEKNDSRMVERE